MIGADDVLAMRAPQQAAMNGHAMAGGERLEITQGKCRRACGKHTGLAAARQRLYLERPAEVLAELASHY